MDLARSDELGELYDAFACRAEPARRTGGVGLGLGLTVAKRIVDARGGTIEITSAAGAGVRALVVIPSVVGGERSEPSD